MQKTPKITQTAQKSNSLLLGDLDSDRSTNLGASVTQLVVVSIDLSEGVSGGSLHIKTEPILEVELLAQKEEHSILSARPSPELEGIDSALPGALTGLSADLGRIGPGKKAHLIDKQVPLPVIEALVDSRSGQGGVVVVVLELPDRPGVEFVGDVVEEELCGDEIRSWEA